MEKRSNGLRSEAEVVASVKQERKRGERSKQWQLTENNPNYTKQEAVERLASVAKTQYAVGCSEVGESGTNHIHVYVVYENAIELGSLKKLFPRAHFEHVRGSVNDNYEYVAKDDPEPYEVGSRPLVVSEWRSDSASEVVALVLEGYHPIEVVKRFPQYSDYVVKNFKNLREMFEAQSYLSLPDSVKIK